MGKRQNQSGEQGWASESPGSEIAPARQRLDLWLWHARVVRTRVLAAQLIGAGHVRINNQRGRAPGKPVKVGDVLTIGLDRQVLVLKILGFAERREAFSLAQLLYKDINAREAFESGR